MERQLVFVPVSRSELETMTGGVELTDRPAHTVTDELLGALGYTPAQSEDAEYAALVLASIAALSRYGERLVLVADVPTSVVGLGADPDNGGVNVSRVPAQAITAWFCEAPGVDSSDAAAAAKDLDIDTAWDFPEVQRLLHESDLLWNDVEEYRRGSGPLA